MLGQVLEGAEPVAFEDGVLTLDVADQFAQTTVESSKRWGPIRAALAQLLGEDARLKKITARVRASSSPSGVTSASLDGAGTSDLLSRVVAMCDGEVIEEAT
jgi:hypothetical protein